ncbi:MAG: ATP-grasp domain-containing protein [Oscillospiraceae bacterium]|nr:ATP-grasp domain-containing protein [Oscillospiraceae bacterium]
MKALVLAGGYPQIALIQELKSRGIKVLLADYYPAPVAKPFADRFYQVSTLDVEAITELAKNEAVDFLITACTDQALLTVAKVSETLGLPCYLDYDTALRVTNKSYMKDVFHRFGIPTADYFVGAQLEEERVAGLQYPCIVKPVDCNSSKGVAKVYDRQSLEQAFDNAVALSRTGTAIVEEFVQGAEITVDVQVEQGRAYVLSKAYSDKIPDDDKFVIYRTRFPVEEPKAIHDMIQDTAQKIADAFGLHNSMMLIQLISDGQRIRVLEFSARTGGGVKHELIKRVSGFDVIKAVVDLTLGQVPHVQVQPPESKYITNVFLYCRPGVFDRLVGFQELKEQGVITDYFLFKWQGAKMTGAASSGDRIAGFTLQAEDLDTLRQKYDVVRKRIKVLDAQGQDILRHDLLGEL